MLICAGVASRTVTMMTWKAIVAIAPPTARSVDAPQKKAKGRSRRISPSRPAPSRIPTD